MKLRILSLLIPCAFSLPLNAQIFHNIYEDTKALKAIYDVSGKLDTNNYYKWFDILQQYVPVESPTDYEKLSDYLKDNPFGLSAGNLLPLKGPYFSHFQSNGLEDVVVVGLRRVVPGPASKISSGVFSTSSVADALTRLIIERGKQELTATFFEQLKKQLNNNKELSIAFPKTTIFINQIESYLYATYLATLREAFVDDICNLPFEIGAILRTPRMKLYMAQNPQTRDVWLVIPILQFLTNLHDGKLVADAIKDVYPDSELERMNADYYNILKMTAVLSESIRDKTKRDSYVPYSDLTTLLSDNVSRKIFFGLLYEALQRDSHSSAIIKEYLTVANEQKIIAILKELNDGYVNLKSAYTEFKKTVRSGTPVTLEQLAPLIEGSTGDLQKTFDSIVALSSNADRLKPNTDLFFKAVPNILTILGNFKEKKYAAGIMNTLILMDSYIATKRAPLQPFKKLEVLDIDHIDISAALLYLQAYAKTTPGDDLSKEIKALKRLTQLREEGMTDAEEKKAEKLFEKLKQHVYDFDANDIYQKLLKYGALMAALSEAKTTEDVTAAIDAAILPVGSSSIKYYTAISFSLNSYIGASYYRAYYSSPGPSGKLYLGTAGVALPIGVNVSVTTRGKIIGAVSLFASVIDLGAVASYRLSSPPDVNSQQLPDFTVQNLLAPGGFIVLNRLFRTPLAIGIGAQKAPELSRITDGVADISKNQTWRFGAFLSVDIPLFNLYSKSLRRPIK